MGIYTTTMDGGRWLNGPPCLPFWFPPHKATHMGGLLTRAARGSAASWMPVLCDIQHHHEHARMES